jgi:hypothetical protein
MNLHKKARTCPKSRALMVATVLEEGRTVAIWLRRPDPVLLHHSDSESVQVGSFWWSEPHSDRPRCHSLGM